MKFAMALLVTTIAASTVFAGETVCLNAKLTSNSHPSLSCGNVVKACVNEFVQDDNARYAEDKIKAKSLTLTDDRNKSMNLVFKGTSVQHESDYGTDISATFDSNWTDKYKPNTVSAYLEIETEAMDYDDRGTIIGTFFDMGLYRAFGPKNNIQVQRCEYSLSK